MTSFKDKTAGAAKEIVGEVVGDAALAEEGKKQRSLRPADEQPAVPEPFEVLRKIP